MALNETYFLYAERGSTNVFKFKVCDDPTIYLWFEYGDSGGALYTSRETGPYRVEHPLGPAEFSTLDELLDARETTREQWVKDLLAQFGEQIGWTYP